MECVGCGKGFESKRVTARYCSAACRVRANRGISTKSGGITEDRGNVISPVVLEMIGGLEKRVAALEGRLVEFGRDIASLEEWRASVEDYPSRKDGLVGKHTFKKDSPEDLFKRVVAEKAERLSIP